MTSLVVEPNQLFWRGINLHHWMSSQGYHRELSWDHSCSWWSIPGINDLLKCSNSDARQFADDCLIYHQIWNQRDAAKLQDDLAALEGWEWRWQMSFHPKKCTVIRISNKRRPLQTTYILHGHLPEWWRVGSILVLPSPRSAMDQPSTPK